MNNNCENFNKKEATGEIRSRLKPLRLKFDKEHNVDFTNAATEEMYKICSEFSKKYNLGQVDEIVNTILSVAGKGYSLSAFNGEFFNFDTIKGLLLNAKNGIQDNSEAWVVDNLGQQDKPTIAKNVSRDFVNSFYFGADNVRQVVEKNAVNEFVNAILLNRELGEVVKGDHSLNSNLRRLQKKLFSDILAYLRTTNSLKVKLLPENASLYTYKNNVLTYTGVFEELYTIMLNYIVNTKQDLAKLHEDVRNGRANINSKLRYKAINAYFLLDNFDQYLKLTFGKSIAIKNFGIFDTDPLKYSIEVKGSNVYATWRVSENIYVEKEINNKVKLLIESVKRYNWDSRETPLSNAYLSFSDFGYIISKIKQISSYIDDINFDSAEANYDYFNELSKGTKSLLEESGSLCNLIDRIRLNPLMYFEAIFELLSNLKFAKLHPEIYKNLRSYDKNILYTVYKGIFSKDNSINSIVGDDLECSYYSDITQVADSIFNVEFLQYSMDEQGNFKCRTLHNQGIDRLSNDVEQVINTANSRNQVDYDKIVEKYIDVQVTETLRNQSGDLAKVKIKIPKTSHYIIFDIKSGLFEVYNGEGKSVVVEESWWNDSNIREFIEDITKIDLGDPENTSDFGQALQEVYNNNQKLVSNLLKLASDIVTNQFILTRIDYRDDPVILARRNASIYKEGEITINYNLKQNNLIRNSNVPIILDLAEAKAILTGLSTSIQVKDGEGNAQSVTTLSRLLGSFRTQWSTQGVKNLGVSNFSILNNKIFKGVCTAKEAHMRTSTKSHTDWNVNEFVYSNFILDYLGSKNTYSNNRFVIGNGIMGFIPSINSDKSTIGRILIDSSKKLFNGKSISEFDINDIKNLICKELGLYYQETLNTIITDLSLLFKDDPFLKEFNAREEYLSGYKKLKAKYGNDAFEYLRRACIRYNQKYPNNRIELTDLVHYVNGPNGLTTNKTLLLLNSRFNTEYANDINKLYHFLNINEWMISKNEDILTSMMNCNFLLNLSGTLPELAQLSSIQGWVDTNSNKAILAKIHFGNNSYNITSKSDIIKILNELGSNPEINLTQFVNKLISDIDSEISELNQKISKYPRVDNGKIRSDYSELYAADSIEIGYLEDIKNDLEFKRDSFNKVEYLLKRNVTDKLKYLIQHFSGGIQIHPEFEKFNYLQYLFSQEFIISTVGSHIAHPAKGNTEDANVEEALRYNAQHKRNVSMTASMHAFQLGLVSGIPDKYNIAVSKDVKTVQSNFAGKIAGKIKNGKWAGGIKPFDGGTFVNPYVVYLENNSLGGQKAGVDKKPFSHFWNEKFGTGGIIKTAGFGNTNGKMRDSIFWRVLHRKTSSNLWKTRKGDPYIVNITKINYGDLYYKGHDGLFYKIIKIISKGNNEYTRVSKLCSSDGTVTGTEIFTEFDYAHNNAVNNCFRLHDLFGGYNSLEINPETNLLEYSEKSIVDVVKAINAFDNDGEIITKRYGFYLPMKHSLIHYDVTEGAIKLQQANINEVNVYEDNDVPFLYMTINNNQTGIQLDKEHHADESDLSLFTQVINACSFNGFTFNEALELYDGLANFSRLQTKEFTDAFNEFKLINGNDTRLKDTVIKIVIDSLVNTSSDTNTMIHKAAKDLIQAAREGKAITFKDSNIPLNDASIYNKVVQSVSSFLTRSGIKVKIPGILSVLHPSVGIMKIYGDRKLGSFKNQTELDNYQLEYDNNPLIDISLPGALDNISKIKIGRHYKVWYNYGYEEVFIETPFEYFNLSNDIRSGNVLKVVENVKVGRDLGAYSARFKVEGYGYFNLYDSDVVRTLFVLENTSDEELSQILNNPIDPNFNLLERTVGKYHLEVVSNKLVLIKELRKLLQNVLDALSEHSKIDTIQINGELLKVDKSSVEVDPYEVVMPKIYATKFGLGKFDDLNDILNDPYFFTRKLIKSYATKTNSFNLELKAANGNHIYLLSDPQITDNLKELNILKYKENGKIYRVDFEGNIIQELSSKNDKIYFDESSKTEIIYTNNFEFYLDNYDYVGINISNNNFLLTLNKLAEYDGDKLKSKFNNYEVNRYINFLNNEKGDHLTANNILNSINTIIPKVDDLTFNDFVNLSKANPVVSYMVRSGNEIFTSFKKSLHVTAARIPAQSLQSFMPMQIVAFENEDVNRAYVSASLIWLQGSKI